VEIRILRSADVHALLPMSECIELMHRTMSAVSEGRVVLPPPQDLASAHYVLQKARERGIGQVIDF